MRVEYVQVAKTRLLQLLAIMIKRLSFVGARTRKPWAPATVLIVRRPSGGKRSGFLAGQMKTPHDFNTMGGEEIGRLFEGNERSYP